MHNLIEALYWGKVLKVVGVGNLAGGPFALEGQIVDHGSEPFALIKGIRLVWAANKSVRVGNSNNGETLLPLSLAATRGFVTLGVGNSRHDPVTIFLVIPLLGLIGI
jgi:hypothetical protein